MATVSYHSDWLKSGRLKRVVDKINNGTSINNEGNIQFDDFDFQQYFDLLSDAFRYPESLNASEIRSLVYRTSIDLRKNGKISEQKLLHLVNLRASEALAVVPQRYTMWTHLRLRRMVWSPGFK